MGHDHLIIVEPVDGGWRVGCDEIQPLMFLSGGRAEAQARVIARCLTRLGDDARVVVHDRDSGLIGAHRYFAE
jgi:hypothetical protein